MQKKMEQCKNCRYSQLLKLHERTIEKIGNGNIVSGVRIKTDTTNFTETLCCTLFANEETGFVMEVLSTDFCECWKNK